MKFVNRMGGFFLTAVTVICGIGGPIAFAAGEQTVYYESQTVDFSRIDDPVLVVIPKPAEPVLFVLSATGMERRMEAEQPQGETPDEAVPAPEKTPESCPEPQSTETVQDVQETEETDPNGALGVFVVTAYCGCEQCNGKWTGCAAANGEPLEAGVTIAVDPNVIPLGSYVEIDGIGVRKAQDTGSAIKGNRIDLFFASHEECCAFGKREMVVYPVR